VPADAAGALMLDGRYGELLLLSRMHDLEHEGASCVGRHCVHRLIELAHNALGDRNIDLRDGRA